MSKKTSQPADISMIYRCGKGWPVFFNFSGFTPSILSDYWREGLFSTVIC